MCIIIDFAGEFPPDCVSIESARAQATATAASRGSPTIYINERFRAPKRGATYRIVLRGGIKGANPPRLQIYRYKLFWYIVIVIHNFFP